MTEQERLDAELKELEPWLDDNDGEDASPLNDALGRQCLGPGCLNCDPNHAPSECYTAEMVADWQKNKPIVKALEQSAALFRAIPAAETPGLLGVLLQGLGGVLDGEHIIPGGILKVLGEHMTEAGDPKMTRAKIQFLLLTWRQKRKEGGL